MFENTPNQTSMLADREIRELCQQETPLIKDAPDFDLQLQSSGFDLTVKRITKMKGNATVGGPHRSSVAAEEDISPIDGWFALKQGAYLVYVNEYTNIPNDLAGLVFARSTLFRSGGMLETGVWDSGFQGRGRLGLFVIGVDSIRIEHNQPIGQIVFFRTSGAEKGFQFNEYFIE